MPHEACTTIILHTRDRPEFVIRCLDYYSRHAAQIRLKLVVADGSRPQAWARLAEDLDRLASSHDIELMHCSAETPFAKRLEQALDHVSTPYVLLAADDDFYMLDWIEAAEDLLDGDVTFGVVYGHVLKFELERFVPYSDRVEFSVETTRNPPFRWLEDETTAQRLTELGNPATDLATAGWYALQRTSLLKLIIATAVHADLNPYGLEKLMIFAQAALARTRKLDRIHLARQVNRDEKRPPYGYRAQSATLRKLLDAAASLLVDHAGLQGEAAEELVALTFRGEIAQLERADSKRHLRTLADRIPQLRSLWTRAQTYRPGPWRTSGTAQDARFPPPPEISSDHPAVKIVREAVWCRGKPCPKSPFIVCCS